MNPMRPSIKGGNWAWGEAIGKALRLFQNHYWGYWGK